VNCDQDIRQRISVSEIPFIYTTDNGWDARLYPEHVDQVGYFYMAVGRPGVGVRNYVAQDGLFRAYWTTDYRYNRQLGTGMEGDLPNDLKYQFGGGVFRLLNGPGPEDDANHYVIYGSIEALVPMGTELGNRTTSPFRGNAGGPDGGPLLTLNSKDVDLCIHPTAVRPGEILEVGDTFSFAGQMFPAVPAKATVSVVSPSGEVHRFDGTANKIGYFYNPAGNVVLTEPGIHEVTVMALFDGVASDGQVLPPYPMGGVLGSHERTFYVYVVEPQSETIAFALDAPEGRIPCSHARWPITGTLPSGWAPSFGHYTVWMAGALLDQGTLAFEGDRFTYVFDPMALHTDFPNLDVGEAPGQFPELVDTISISLFVKGTDNAGEVKEFAGRIDLQGLEYFVPMWMQAEETISERPPAELLAMGKPVEQEITLSLPHGSLHIAVMITRDADRGVDVYEYTVANTDHCGFGTFAVANHGLNAEWIETSPRWGGELEGERWLWDGDGGRTPAAGTSVFFRIAVTSPSLPTYGRGSIWPSSSCCSNLQQEDSKVDFEILTASGSDE
ncbi:hypothetical protein KAJ02_13320, partial [Candidatus Bipolaricaulota bacterium]|nr:hypothetical protein [Candidatus Bipolaricaulota bacterium]